MSWFKPLRLIWLGWCLLWLLLTTVPIASSVVILGFLGLKDSQLQFLARLWARFLIYGVGCPVSLEGQENVRPGQTYIFVGNHSSALDIPARIGHYHGAAGAGHLL